MLQTNEFGIIFSIIVLLTITTTVYQRSYNKSLVLLREAKKNNFYEYSPSKVIIYLILCMIIASAYFILPRTPLFMLQSNKSTSFPMYIVLMVIELLIIFVFFEEQFAVLTLQVAYIIIAKGNVKVDASLYIQYLFMSMVMMLYTIFGPVEITQRCINFLISIYFCLLASSKGIISFDYKKF